MADWQTLLSGMLTVAPPQAATQTLPLANKQPTSEQEEPLSLAHIKFTPIYVYDAGYSLYDIMMRRHPPSWSKFFLSAEPDIRHACEKISMSASGRSVFPLVPDVLAAFWLTPLPLLKVVIIGQDPYPGVTKAGWPKAVGISFGSHRETGEIPDSLVTVYKELAATVEGWEHPGHADIRCWGRQGVLLYNTALTVEAGKPGAHSGFWKTFTERLMDFLNENARDCVFLLWGKVAQKAAETIFSSRHLKLIAYHPSSMNANREGFSFLGCNHFNLANIYLVEKGIHPIDWRIQ